MLLLERNTLEPGKRSGKPCVLLFFLILFIVFPFIHGNAQPYHYPFNYNHSGLNRIDDAFFDELEKDLGRSIALDKAAFEYRYIQHLRNKNTFLSLYDKAAELNHEENATEIFLLLQRIVADFPTQTTGYYQLSRFFMNKGKVTDAIDVLKKAAMEFNLSPESFSYLTQLYAENDEFIRGYNDLMRHYKTKTTLLPDSNWIALYDSIKQQDQLYRGKFRLDDPRFEPQYQIDEQNALFLTELLLEHGWFSKFLGRDYHFAHTPVMHFAIEHQLFFLDFIIADCMAYQARWFEAEQVLWKMINHTTRVIINDETYHSLPLLYNDSETGIIDLEQSMLAIRSAVLAMYGCGGNRSDIWLIATSELSDVYHTESLKAIKKYFVLLGLDQDKIHVQESLLEREIEDQLKLKTPVVLKRKP